MNNKIIASISAITVMYVGSLLIHPLYKGVRVGFYDYAKGHVEFMPDVYVTYKCKEYDWIPGYAMVPNKSHTEVTVNWGGLGRRKGLTNFVCKTK